MAAGPEAPALFVGGAFTSASGATVQNVAKWNGTTWSNVGGGTSGFVDDFVAFDADGPGGEPASLYATGAFVAAGGATVNGIARWNGATWTSVGGGLNAPGFALAAFDDDGPGPGAPALFVGGTFTQAGPVACAADLDGDEDVDAADLAVLLGSWGA